MTDPRAEVDDTAGPDSAVADTAIPGTAVPDTARSSVFVAAGILLSRVGGLIREIALAATLGTSVAADAFRAALRIPQLLQNLLGEGALSAAFIPVYADLLERDEEEAGRVAGAVAGLIAATTAFLVLIGVSFAAQLTTLLAPGFTGEAHDLAVQMTRVMVGGIGFVVLAAWCLGVLNAHRKFFLSYAAPVLWNAAQIAALVTAAILGWTEAGIAQAAAWGMLAGGILQFLVQVPAVHRVAPKIHLSLRRDLPGVRQVLRRFGPAVLGRGALQLGAYLDLVLASLLVTGSVARLDFAQILYLLPVSLFAISIAAAELPELSRTSDPVAMLDRLAVGIRRVTFLIFGTSVLFLVGAGGLVATIYQHGEFRASDTVVVWLALAGYSLGLIANGASRLLQNGLFAGGDTAGPAKVALIRVGLSAALGALLMLQLDRVVVDTGDRQVDDVVELVGNADHIHRDGDLPAFEPLSNSVRADESAPPRLGVVGLALGSAAGAWLEYVLLRRLIRRSLGAAPPFARTVASLVPAGAAGALALVGTQLLTDGLAPWASGLVSLGVGGAVYVVVAAVTGVDLAGLRTVLRRSPEPSPTGD